MRKGVKHILLKALKKNVSVIVVFSMAILASMYFSNSGTTVMPTNVWKVVAISIFFSELSYLIGYCFAIADTNVDDEEQ